MTAPHTAAVAVAGVAPGPRFIALLSAIAVVACAAYCIGYALIAGGGVDPLLSLTWAMSTVAPWVACWPLLRRAVLHVGTEGAARWSRVLPPLGLAAIAAAALERTAALAFGVEHGLAFAELVFRKLPVVIGFALAARLYVRVARAREPRRGAPETQPPVEVAAAAGSMECAPDVDWVKAAGNYLELHTGGRCDLVRKTLTRFASEGADRFLRIHRSVLVNRDRIAGLEQRPRGRLVLRLRDGRTLPVGRGFRADVERALGG
jgi:hypothetical protein